MSTPATPVLSYDATSRVLSWVQPDLAVLMEDPVPDQAPISNREWQVRAWDSPYHVVFDSFPHGDQSVTVGMSWAHVEVRAVEVLGFEGDPPDRVMHYGQQSFSADYTAPQPPPAQPVYYVDQSELYNPGVTGGYVRHRDRMVQQSVFEDLRDTLIAFGWLSGTTTRAVVNPETGQWGPMTTAPDGTLALLDDSPINLIDFFPEMEQGVEVGEPATGRTPFNTLALDNGTRMDSAPLEMGNAVSEEVLYRFTLAFYASSDAIAQALLGDLADRYRGRQVRDDTVELWNYNRDDALPVVRMSVENFTFTSAADQEVSYPAELKLYFAELLVEDEVDGGPIFVPPATEPAGFGAGPFGETPFGE